MDTFFRFYIGNEAVKNYTTNIVFLKNVYRTGNPGYKGAI